jgi:hypothetical protein
MATGNNPNGSARGRGLSIPTVLAIVLALMLAMVSGTSGLIPRPGPSPAPGDWMRTELYFGTDSHRGVVTDEAFAEFVDRQVAPRFPGGLTLLTGDGLYSDSKSVPRKERSKVLIILIPRNKRNANHLIQEVRDAYKKQFEQESVLRVDSRAVVSF